MHFCYDYVNNSHKKGPTTQILQFSFPKIVSETFRHTFPIVIYWFITHPYYLNIYQQALNTEEYLINFPSVTEVNQLSEQEVFVETTLVAFSRNCKENGFRGVFELFSLQGT